MNEKLIAFVQTVVKQHLQLDRAMAIDDIAIQAWRQDKERTRPREAGRRRRWTRRDVRLFEESVTGATPLIRTEKFLARYFPGGQCSIAPLTAAAICEAQAAGRWELLIDGITELASAHRLLLVAVAQRVKEATNGNPPFMDDAEAGAVDFQCRALDRIGKIAPEVDEIVEKWLRMEGWERD